MATDAAVRWMRHPGALWRDGLGRVLVLPPGADDAFALRGSGPLLWDALAAPVTVDEACRQLADVYSVPPAAITPDVERTLGELRGRDAVVTLP